MLPAILETTDFDLAIQEEARLPAGKYTVVFSVVSPLSKEELTQIHEYLLENGVAVKGRIMQQLNGLWQVSITYQKPAPSQNIAFAPVAIIPLVFSLGIMTLIGVGIFKAKELAMFTLVAGAVIVGGIFVLGRAIREAPGVLETVTSAARR